MVWTVHWRVCTNICVYWLATTSNPHKGASYTSAVPADEIRYLSTGDGCKSHARHNDVAIWERPPSGLWFFLKGPEVDKLHFSIASYHFFINPEAENRKCADILKVDAVALLPCSVFIDIGNVKHAPAEYIWHANLRYYDYRFFSDKPLHNSIIYKYD